jgi:transcriptional regulator with XRE-family HTH domain
MDASVSTPMQQPSAAYAEVVRKYRLVRGLTQLEVALRVAELLEMARQKRQQLVLPVKPAPETMSAYQIAHIEHGRSLPSQKTHQAIIEAFQLSNDDRETLDALFHAARARRQIAEDGAPIGADC